MSLNEDIPVVRVFGGASGMSQMDSPHPAPDTTVGEVLFANGVRGQWNNGSTAPKAIDNEASYMHCRVAAYAEGGRTLFEEFGNWEIASPDGVERSRIPQEEWGLKNDQSQAGLVNAMFDWLEDDARPAGTHLKAALHQWNVVLGLYAGALFHKPINIPFEPPDDLFTMLGEAL